MWIAASLGNLFYQPPPPTLMINYDIPRRDIVTLFPKRMLLQCPLTIASGSKKLKHTHEHNSCRHLSIKFQHEWLKIKRDIKEMNSYFYCNYRIWGLKSLTVVDWKRVGISATLMMGRVSSFAWSSFFSIWPLRLVKLYEGPRIEPHKRLVYTFWALWARGRVREMVM